jgi:hydrogenase maturation protein HypF
VRREITYDGQAAVELEALARRCPTVRDPYELSFRPGADGSLEIDLRACVRRIAADLRRGVEAPVVAARFHETMAWAVAETCARARRLGGPSTAALTGGCFANRRLTERCAALLEERGFSVLIHRRVPPNDGGLALGQAAVAAELARRRGDDR